MPTPSRPAGNSPSHFIGAEWHAGTGAPMTVIDPATGVTIWHGSAAGADEVAAACAAARAASAAWAMTPLAQRIGIC